MKKLQTLFALSFLLHTQVTLADDLDWLVGCWQTADGSSKEVWVKEPDGSLIGFAVAVSGNGVDFYEVLRVVVNQDGVMAYTAYPEGQSPATFIAKNATDTSIVFSNPDHDYPQEIAYKLDGATLNATISGLDGQNPHSFEKQRCD